MFSGRRAVFILFSLHAIFIIACVLVLQLVFDFNPKIFLVDDGYYQTSKLIVEGEASFAHTYRAPGLPFLFLVLHFFPPLLHPYLRLVLTLGFSFGSIYVAYAIFRQVMGERAVFYGLLLSLFNPMYIHWTLKSSPESYTTFFLGIVMFAYLKFWNTAEKKYVFLLVSILVASILVKPVLLFVPLLVALYGFIIREKRMIAVSMLAFFICMVSFCICYRTQKSEEGMSYAKGFTINSTYMVETILHTRRLNTGHSLVEDRPEVSNAAIAIKSTEAWIENYKKTYHNTNLIFMNIRFIRDNFWLFLKTRILSFFLFISLTSTIRETLLTFFVNLTLISIGLYSLRQKFGIHRVRIIIILSILMGYVVLHLLVAPGLARYSIPFMFYFSVFAGIAIEKMMAAISQIYYRYKSA